MKMILFSTCCHSIYNYLSMLLLIVLIQMFLVIYIFIAIR